VDTRSATPWTEAGQDPELLRQAQRGDLSAALQICAAHAAPLWRACFVLTQHPREAERLFEETIERATRELPSAPARQPLLPWLTRLARELDANRASMRPRDPSDLGAVRPDGRPWDEDAPDTAVERHALHGFSQLDASDQWLLALRLFEGLSYEDIARVTGVPIERVAERLAFARDQIDQAYDVEERAA
jgi:DNA-directed RNA polymerase specialized sigma24 family protein